MMQKSDTPQLAKKPMVWHTKNGLDFYCICMIMTLILYNFYLTLKIKMKEKTLT